MTNREGETKGGRERRGERKWRREKDERDREREKERDGQIDTRTHTHIHSRAHKHSFVSVHAVFVYKQYVKLCIPPPPSRSLPRLLGGPSQNLPDRLRVGRRHPPTGHGDQRLTADRPWRGDWGRSLSVFLVHSGKIDHVPGEGGVSGESLWGRVVRARGGNGYGEEGAVEGGKGGEGRETWGEEGAVFPHSLCFWVCIWLYIYLLVYFLQVHQSRKQPA